MTDIALDSVPDLRAAAAAQIRAVGLAVRREVLVTFTVLAAFLAYTTAIQWSQGNAIELGYLDELGVLAGLACFLFPIFVWKGEDRFGLSTLWTLPVDHARHALVKVGAGWAWAMAFTVGFGLLLILPVLVTGGPLGEEFTRLVGNPAAGETMRSVTWSTPAWWWLLPFGAGTAAYLLGSALVLATRHPWRWILGAVALFWLFGFMGEEGEVEWMDWLFERVLFVIGLGRYGLETLLTSGVQSNEVWLRDLPGEPVKAWRELPSIARWGTAVLLWSAVGLFGMVAATWRHREH